MKENEGPSSEGRMHQWSREEVTKYGRRKRKKMGGKECGRRKSERRKRERRNERRVLGVSKERGEEEKERRK